MHTPGRTAHRMGKRSREKRLRVRESTPPGPRPAGRAARPARAANPPPPSVLDDPGPPATGPVPWATLLRQHQVPLAVLFASAFLMRAVLLYTISGTPYFEAGNIDSEAYQEWATGIAGGRWWPAGHFYQSPFYAYFLAILYTVFGVGDQWSPRIVQILFGSVSPLLVYGIGTRLFTRRVGWIAGLLVAFYGPMVLEEITISKTTLLITSALAAFTLYLRHGPWARPGGMAAAGAVMGLTVVGVGQWLPAFLALALYAYFLPERATVPARRAGAAAFLAGGLAIMLPMIVWNTSQGGGLILTSADAGLNLYTGNNPKASGLPREPDGVRNIPRFEEADARRAAEQKVGHPLTPAQVSAYWSGAAVDWAALNPGEWLALVGQKLVTLWNAYEIPDNYHYPFMRQYFLPPLWAMVTLAVVAPLALVGAVLPFWRRRDVSALYVMAGVYLATVLLFYVRGRYRMPAVPFLAVFAAVAVERTIRALTARDPARVAMLVGGLVVAGMFTNHRYCEAAHDGLPDICLGGDTWYDQEWLKVSEWYRNRGMLERALAYAERARECTSPRSAGMIVYWLGELELMWTQALLRDQQREDAAPHAERALDHFRAAQKLDFRRYQSAANLGLLHSMMGRFPEAIAALEPVQAAGRLDRPGSQRLGRAYAAVGRCTDAERVLVKLDGGNASDDTRGVLEGCVPR
jgi:4-amino-4-deoxy-L-arabinose transferase-like glycosyltransferase